MQKVQKPPYFYNNLGRRIFYIRNQGGLKGRDMANKTIIVENLMYRYGYNSRLFGS
jgi:hypothetical protein